MAYDTSKYWINKNQRAELAKKHADFIEQNYGEDVQYSIERTDLFDTTFTYSEDENVADTEIIVDAIDSVGAIFKHHDSNKINAVLNFSSYKNPGGMFLKGSKAQEECLCHESTLFNVLIDFTTDFYDWNNKNKNKALYKNRALYSDDILFMRDHEQKYCDVITCAAPNKTAAQKYCHVTDKENSEVLESRIEYVLQVAKYENAQVLILGAYGCGVFGQDPTEVATIFKKLLCKYSFDKVIFAIPDENGENYKAFAKVFK